ncbi:hypothetical protein BEWA_008490 [Theileria equi strain WA]|uniref:Uncharacterized protein n=1 Tax=Theileria equi strain WA TaxID=1537102 RepID=L0B2W5_THEEQ|nr:hypothetical protein BEWA_008490 [Theileria equi strain WA]AFZ81439.1 hypothetical protein BEWA_008490 [Theileria equi strain WA]|eukprot:XP_004831105.1 hypothetical protein BEWA_008490 [Theileria equi strain WA]
MSKSKENGDDGKKGIRSAAALLFGLTICQTPHIAFSSGKFTISRFKIPQHCLGLYINRMIITFKLWTFVGVMAMTTYDIFCGKIMGEINSTLMFSVLATYLMMLLTYYTGGNQGHLTLYFWVITTMSLIMGLIFITAVKVMSDNISFLIVSFPLAGIWVSLYHLLFLFIWRYFRLQNTHYWLVFWQLVIAVSMAGLTLMLWFVGYGFSIQESGQHATAGSGEGSNSDIFTALKQAWHPILMSGIGYGMQNLVYPSIAPYKLAGSDGHGIYLTTLFTGSVPPLTLLCLSKIGKGPDVKWSENQIWHGCSLCVIVEILCAALFICGLHYPDWKISQAITGNTCLLWILTILYDFCVQVANAVGSNGAPVQGKKRNSTMSTVNSSCYSFTQIIFSSIGDGYMRTYQKHENDRENWPTKHCGNLRAFWFWTWNATKVSLSEFKTALTTDLRGAIQTKKEYLFIVYSDDTDNSSNPPKTKNPTVMKIVHDI